MITEIILGALIGTGLLAGLGYWYNQRLKASGAIDMSYREEEEEEESGPITNTTLLLDLPIEKKLRNALFECERGESECLKEIDTIFEMQLDLLKGLGKASHVEVKDKPAFFIVFHPIRNEKRFYYSRDIYQDIEPQILTDTQRVLTVYDEHIDLYLAKVEMFRRLINSHQENLNRIHGIQEQHEQLEKLKRHKKNISKIEENVDLEAKALKNQALLEDIERELTYQSECLEQYAKISTEFDQSLNKNIDISFKYKIQDIINKLEEEDPDLKD